MCLVVLWSSIISFNPHCTFTKPQNASLISPPLSFLPSTALSLDTNYLYGQPHNGIQHSSGLEFRPTHHDIGREIKHPQETLSSALPELRKQHSFYTLWVVLYPWLLLLYSSIHVKEVRRAIMAKGLVGGNNNNYELCHPLNTTKPLWPIKWQLSHHYH